ncbi:pentatricopeptide repeat-containing protein At3g18970-like [Chenopodium quinoa]|uniref:pentatricopeptide repeat-containing protein At3g18970-like n=1 Tax=Chenopodium quinoa TaxID=63459 RepID=UPI000B77DA89|nr:pentatricopeptide repeat-containing protein At3g18970-like [Chenopodium quinoa]
MSSTSKLIYTLLHRKPKSFNQLKQIHAILITTNLKSPSTLAKLIENHFLLSPNQAPIHAHLIVNHNQTDYQLFLLNTLIKCSLPRDSIHLFAKWVSVSSIVFDDYTFIFALGACARSPSVSGLYEGKQIHARAMKLGFMPDLLVSTTALHFYANNGGISFARKVFDEMPVRSSATWNALITGYSSQKQNSHENSIKALVSFKEMMVAGDSDVKPNGMTLVCVLSAVSQLGSLESGCSVHGYIAKTIDAPENDVYVGTSLVGMYSKCGCLGIASKVFAMMSERNVRTWTAMVTGLAFYGKGREAIELLNEMRECDVRPNTVTFTSMLSACCHAGLVEEGLYLFHNMEKEFGVAPQIEHYGCVVDLLGKAGLLREAYDFIVGMPTESNSVLWRSLLGSCRLHGDFVMGERVGKILLQLQSDLHLGNERSTSKDYIGLSNVYALAERWEDVGTIREEMRMNGLEIKPGHSAVH